ncbi:MAG TPA: acyltransferase, partial [Candidatus Acidoferrales bacterium]|nr:acyltransferase [Candidatus Acidoferrales bacterium]
MNGKINTLQAGRGLAAIMVLLCHTEFVGFPYQLPVLHPFIFQGAHGVDFFFVLSGFIIFYTNRPFIGVPAMAPFYYYRRLIRVYPLLLVITAVKLIFLGLGGRGIPAEKNNFSDVVFSTLLLPQTKSPFISVSWTLSYEVFFYSLFLLAILFGRSLLPFFLLHAAACLLLLLPALAPAGYPFDFLFSPYILEFYAGCVIAWWYAGRKWQLPPKSAIIWLGGGLTLLVLAVGQPMLVKILFPNCG